MTEPGEKESGIAERATEWLSRSVSAVERGVKDEVLYPLGDSLVPAGTVSDNLHALVEGVAVGVYNANIKLTPANVTTLYTLSISSTTPAAVANIFHFSDGLTDGLEKSLVGYSSQYASVKKLAGEKGVLGAVKHISGLALREAAKLQKMLVDPTNAKSFETIGVYLGKTHAQDFKTALDKGHFETVRYWGTFMGTMLIEAAVDRGFSKLITLSKALLASGKLKRLRKPNPDTDVEVGPNEQLVESAPSPLLLETDEIPDEAIQLGRAPVDPDDFNPEKVIINAEDAPKRKSKKNDGENPENGHDVPSDTDRQIDPQTAAAQRWLPIDKAMAAALVTLNARIEKFWVRSMQLRSFSPRQAMVDRGGGRYMSIDSDGNITWVTDKKRATKKNFKELLALHRSLRRKFRTLEKKLDKSNSRVVNGVRIITDPKVVNEFRTVYTNAKYVGKQLYTTTSNRFWSEAWKDTKFRTEFKRTIDAINRDYKALMRADGPKGAELLPLMTWEKGKKPKMLTYEKWSGEMTTHHQTLTLEHKIRQTDQPFLTVDPSNIVVSPRTENVKFLERIRDHFPQQHDDPIERFIVANNYFKLGGE